jgi:hypothetical protein
MGSKWGTLVPENGWIPALESEFPVAMFTVRLPVEFAGTDSLTGLKPQDEFDGSELHENVKVPVDPFRGLSISV